MHTLPSTPCRIDPTNHYQSTSYAKRYHVHTCTTKGVCQFLTRICKYSDFPVVMFKKADAPTMQLRIGPAPLSGQVYLDPRSVAHRAASAPR